MPAVSQYQTTNILYTRTATMSKIPSYHYVSHKDTDQQGYRINEGKYSGIVWQYHNVKMPVYDESGEVRDPSELNEIPLTFDCEVLYNPTDEDLSAGEFEKTIGDILLNLIDESLSHDTVEFRSDNSNEFDL